MRRTTTALALVFAAGAGLSACGSDTISEKITEKAVEAGSGEDVDIDFDGDGVTIETEDGTVSSDEDGNFSIETDDGTYTAQSGGDIPDALADLPLPDDFTVLSSAESTDDAGTSYQVSGTSSQDPAEIFADFIDAMEADGYTTDGKTESNTGGAVFAGATFVDGGDQDVNLTIVGDGESDATISLVVFPAAA